MLNITLHIKLALFSIGWRRKGNHAINAWAHPFRYRAYGAAFSRAITAFKNNNHTFARLLHPFLQFA